MFSWWRVTRRCDLSILSLLSDEVHLPGPSAGELETREPHSTFARAPRDLSVPVR